MNNTLVRKKINSLQALRALAFINVLACHCNKPLLSGAAGVSIFLVLSGFLMYRSYCDKPTLDYSLKGSFSFSLKKIKRLFPLHIIMTIPSLLLSFIEIIRYFNFNSLLFWIFKVVMNITLLKSWIPIRDIYCSLNVVSWYLTVAMFTYFVFPKLLKCLKKISVRKAIILAISIYICQCLIGLILKYLNFDYDITYYIVYVFPITRLGDFIIGCCLGHILLNTNISPSKKAATGFEIIAFLLWAFVETIYLNDIGIGASCYFKYTQLFTPISTFLVCILSINRGYISRFISNKYLVFVGDISSYAFLIHIEIMILVGKFLNYFFPEIIGFNYILAILSFFLTILITVLYMKLEKKFKIYSQKHFIKK